MLVAGLVVAATLILFAVLLSAPLDVRFRWDTAAGTKAQFRLVWLYGLIQKDLGGGRPQEVRERKGRKKSKPSMSALKRLRAVLRTRGLTKAILRFLRRSLASTSVRNLSLHIRFGLDDPADTGMLFGAIAPVVVLLKSSTPAAISVEPEFGQEAFSASAAVDVRVYTLILAYAVLALILSPAAIRAGLNAAFPGRAGRQR